MNKKAVKINVYGRVTGVGFRWAALNRAASFSSLRGFVRNASYDQVEAVVQGTDAEVDAMIEWFRHGPSHARVEKMTVVDMPVADSLGVFKVKSGW